MTGKPTIFDVARKVGVSGKTVSRVVNNDPNVSDKMREAVSAAIAELGYHQNFAARSLRSKRSFMLGVLSPPQDFAYYHSSHARLSTACRLRGYHLVYEQVDLDAQGAVAAVRDLLDTVDFAGLVLMPGIERDERILDLLRQHGKAWVAFGTDRSRSGGMAVRADENGAAGLAADHLWDLGHRRFCILEAPKGTLARGPAFERRLRERGADPALFTHFRIDPTLPPMEIGRRAAIHAMDAVIRPTAMFALTDANAAGVISTLLATGVKVPEQMSVVGFDDSEIASAIFPALTTLRQPLAEMAETAIGMLVDQHRKDGPPEACCPIELVIRQSTARAPD
ncbi:LacI family transcriptional regulator [Sphingomonas sp. LH128]|uniref:LacI family DNA-binding transcriptional regulator n=1 Tax=Sphingomonas sp. LH128 TaxID=473781 RepID=UPI00027CBFD8|nr:LacI family DNA-binding transcriptional regulator [Sphingomonas sp. LH128]EJU11931.1 LacI family transcriptional regulator [Sphingomonas sp. LH128]